MDLLLELFSEEIPARMQPRAADDLKTIIKDDLIESNLTFSNVRGYATPRRLAISVEGLPKAQPDVKEERRGPRADAPEKAIKGFLKANGVILNQCEKRNTGKGEFWFVVIEQIGLSTADVIKKMLPETIYKLKYVLHKQIINRP